MLQSKDIERPNVYENKTGTYVGYKKLTSDLKTHTE